MTALTRIPLPVSDVTATLEQTLRCMALLAPDVRAGFRDQALYEPNTIRDADLIVIACDVLGVRS